eukprot:scaffold142651_cov60-Attheya_sp.AAC.1
MRFIGCSFGLLSSFVCKNETSQPSLLNQRISHTAGPGSDLNSRSSIPYNRKQMLLFFHLTLESSLQGYHHMWEHRMCRTGTKVG